MLDKELKYKMEAIIKSLPNGQTKFIVGAVFDDLFEEIKRLRAIAVQAHDGLLRGHSDSEIMEILRGAWRQSGE